MPGSILAGHLGDRAVVDSYHHQAVRDLGTGLEAVALAPHGTVEAIEMPSSRAFVLGVQWELHEEWQDDERSFEIWRTFVSDARRRMEERLGTREAAAR
jgi:putative glutamine amidotransferase